MNTSCISLLSTASIVRVRNSFRWKSEVLGVESIVHRLTLFVLKIQFPSLANLHLSPKKYNVFSFMIKMICASKENEAELELTIEKDTCIYYPK